MVGCQFIYQCLNFDARIIAKNKLKYSPKLPKPFSTTVLLSLASNQSFFLRQIEAIVVFIYTISLINSVSFIASIISSDTGSQ